MGDHSLSVVATQHQELSGADEGLEARRCHRWIELHELIDGNPMHIEWARRAINALLSCVSSGLSATVAQSDKVVAPNEEHR